MIHVQCSCGGKIKIENRSSADTSEVQYRFASNPETSIDEHQIRSSQEACGRFCVASSFDAIGRDYLSKLPGFHAVRAAERLSVYPDGYTAAAAGLSKVHLYKHALLQYNINICLSEARKLHPAVPYEINCC